MLPYLPFERLPILGKQREEKMTGGACSSTQQPGDTSEPSEPTVGWWQPWVLHPTAPLPGTPLKSQHRIISSLLCGQLFHNPAIMDTSMRQGKQLLQREGTRGQQGVPVHGKELHRDELRGTERRAVICGQQCWVQRAHSQRACPEEFASQRRAQMGFLRITSSCTQRAGIQEHKKQRTGCSPTTP